MKLITRIILFFIALNFMAVGIALYLKTNIGVGSWDVLHNNLYEFYGLSVGTWVFIVGVISILLSQLFYFNLRNLLAIITGLIQGQFIDLWLENIFIFDLGSLYIRVPLFLLSITFLGFGISLLVLTKLPPSPPDIYMLSLVHRFKFKFVIAKTITELSAFIAAIIIGIINKDPFNNIGLGTLLTLLLIGSIVQISSRFWKKILRLT